MSEEKIAISTIRCDGGTQARAAMNDDYVQDLRAVLKKGGELPEVVVFSDGKDRWLADGFHTVAAYEAEDKTYIMAKIRNGTQRQAILYAVGANESHGLRRTNEDKRHAVGIMLADEEWVKSSDNWIAEQCRVSDKTVADVRKSTSEIRSSNGTPETRIGKDGKKRPATRKPKPKPTDNATTAETEGGREPEEEEAILDAAGQPVPDEAREAFATAAKLKDWGNRMDAMIREMGELIKLPGGRLTQFETAATPLKNGKNIVLQNRATHVCPMDKCKADGNKCPCCKGERWTAAHVWKRLSDDKVKK